nr:NAD(P)/FAD-dependent oxidoreductase [Mycobacterium sp. E1715]
MTHAASTDRPLPDVDVVVVGAGIAGLYLAYRLSRAGYRFRVFEAGDDLGGTWYWNRYPGARVDVPSVDYMYSFDPDWHRDWRWSEKYATQPEILRYLNHVADKHDLRRHLTFSTRVQRAGWDDDVSLWRVGTDRGDELTSRFVVMATGCLSLPKQAEVRGLERFAGEIYFTSAWPHEPVDFTGKRVAVIGTGSSGVQSIPVIAQEAAQLVVFQRTPNFSIPAHNGPVPPSKIAQLPNEAEYRAAAKLSFGGIPMERDVTPTFGVSEAERQRRYERAWADGLLFEAINVFADVLSNPAANHEYAEFFRDKIRSIVDDPDTAAELCPTDHPLATKRPCLDTNYYATYNLPHVRLVNVRKHPIREITATGIDTTDESFAFDAIVFATGFDAVTGAITAVDIRGRNGLALKGKWADGPRTYLGLTTAGFPNLFFITGPGSPSVLTNMVVSIEQHADWVLDCLGHLSADGFEVIEPTELGGGRVDAARQRLRRHHPLPPGELVVHGRQCARQIPGLPAVLRGLRLLPCRLRRGGRPRLPGLQEIWPRRLTLQRRSGAPVAAGRRDGPQRGGGAESAADGIDGRPGGSRVVRADVDGATAGTGCRRDRRRRAARPRRRFGVPALSACHPGSASGGRVFPWRWLRSRRRRRG